MPQYLVAIHHPDNFDPSTVTEETMRDIGALNKEMMAAGVRFFAGGLQPETKAKSLRAQPNGPVLITNSVLPDGGCSVSAGIPLLGFASRTIISGSLTAPSPVSINTWQAITETSRVNAATGHS